MTEAQQYFLLYPDRLEGDASVALLRKCLMRGVEFEGAKGLIFAWDNEDPTDLPHLEGNDYSTHTLLIVSCCPSVDWLQRAVTSFKKVEIIDPKNDIFFIKDGPFPSDILVHFRNGERTTMEVICRIFQYPLPWWLEHIRSRILRGNSAKSSAICRAIFERQLDESYKGFDTLSAMDPKEKAELEQEGCRLLKQDFAVTIPAYVNLSRCIRLGSECKAVVVYLPPDFGKRNRNEWELLLDIACALVASNPEHVAMIVDREDLVYCCLRPDQSAEEWLATMKLSRQKGEFFDGFPKMPSTAIIKLPTAYTKGVGKAWLRLQTSDKD